MLDNQTFEAIRERTATRRFSQQLLPEGVLETLLELANEAPSGFNLQPWHYVVVNDPNMKKLLSHVAMSQPQIVDAPATVIFVADPKAWKTTYPKVLALGTSTKAMTEKHARFYKKKIWELFVLGPLSIIGFAKKIAVPILRLKQPLPYPITSKSEALSYVRSQTMLSAMTFMIAAKSAGLDTSPMEGFDEDRLKKLLNIPSSMTVPIIISVGYELQTDDKKPSVRLPLKDKLSFNLFGNKES